MKNNEITQPEPTLFLVQRTSIFSNKKKPCREAFRIQVIRTDRRSTDDPTKIPAYKDMDPSWWYNEGTNHRLQDGFICRDFGTIRKWAVRIEDLMQFVAKYGTCVISLNWDGYNEIEIYDDRRED